MGNRKEGPCSVRRKLNHTPGESGRERLLCNAQPSLTGGRAVVWSPLGAGPPQGPGLLTVPETARGLSSCGHSVGGELPGVELVPR